ncbi:MAG: sigma-70 family RNA polymerase sigma factor [Candidatus Eremiobacteraeota bacterium]|nr:sigma-70 family RNA polymerase sigma factor [Candidatus Eremiobacteraeota bacterium]MBC5827406.1 sigma-70 family RNA polymerase sigma factor [Candidatus Eremiobacteraeota bacterium]
MARSVKRAGPVECADQDPDPDIVEYERSRSIEGRDRIVFKYAYLAESIAGKMAREPDQRGDFVQVGYVGLLKAVDRFDGSLRVPFSAYARSMISGEISHHLRDFASAMRVPRWYQGLNRRFNGASDRLFGKLLRTPTAAELAAEMNLTDVGMAELLSLREHFRIASADDGASLDDIDRSQQLRSPRYVSFRLPVEDRIALDKALENLANFERRIVYLFFYMDFSQTEIARRLGSSQKHISRTIARAISQLKTDIHR